MIQRNELLDYMNDLLEVHRYQDYCPNGLQVEGKSQINSIITGVTANEALILKAIEKNADAILVHHGFFWKGEQPIIHGIKRKRIKLLLENNINLIAYHLPLDGHGELGNNVQLAKVLGINYEGRFDVGMDVELGFWGELPQPMTGDELENLISSSLGREPLHIPASKDRLVRIGWCTGAAQDYIEQAAKFDLDGYISGEISERTTHYARELDIHYFAAGHHATERYGIQALGQHLQDHFKINHTFVDIDNPV